ncbi:fimbria/pilus periplasmic chaperone [Klebsiella aerogenes]|uniref:fimbria/pilus periplasmic chaperone n=1 Tax=Klebsiella aerogenes TaxID=548 RepID=UPI00063CB9F6|nr:fimbria/pilus periplasmic chaperone [Klebsiella aerogenes]KLE96190.1 molecular chaperone [Klebsiella aerogenes]
MKRYVVFVLFWAWLPSSFAALTVDRSRMVINEGERSVSIGVTNPDRRSPYLAQGWIEDESGKKVPGPLIVIPPVQRLEAGSSTRVRIQALDDIASLPKDKESVFYFNLREIPPKTDKPNVLVLAVQTRLKVFYRPKGLKVDEMAHSVPGTESLTLSRANNRYVVHNPTPYHFSFVGVRTALNGSVVENVEPVMVSPRQNIALGSDIPVTDTPVLVFVNDFGSQMLLPFRCAGSTCKAGHVQQTPL